MEKFEKLLPWIVVINLLAVIALAIVFFTQKPSTAVTDLSNRVGVVETGMTDVQGDLGAYQRWADSVQAWAEESTDFMNGIWGLLTQTPPAEDVICPACLDSDTVDPPDGGPCKPGQC